MAALWLGLFMPASAGDRPNNFTGPSGLNTAGTYWRITTLQVALKNFPRP
ncbi:protein of unknown function [Hyphomicrobium sp. 1Nfss2.1]